MFDAYRSAIGGSDEAVERARRFESGFVVGEDFVHPENVPFVFVGYIPPDAADWLRSVSFYSKSEAGSRQTHSRLETNYREISETQLDRFLKDVEREGQAAIEPNLRKTMLNDLGTARSDIEYTISAARSECLSADYGFQRTLPLDSGPFAGVGKMHCTGAFVASYSLVLKDHVPKSAIVEFLKSLLALQIVAAVAWLIFETGVTLAQARRTKLS
jgi:hypothetical protein